MSEHLNPAARPEIDLLHLLKCLWTNWWVIAVATVGFAITGVLSWPLVPVTYTATATILPKATSNLNGLGISSDLASLAGLGGANLGASGENSVLALLGSRSLLELTVNRLDVAAELTAGLPLGPSVSPERRFQLAVGLLTDAVSYEVDRSTGVVSVKTSLKSAALSQKVANGLLDSLDASLLDKALVAGKRRMELLAQKIAVQKDKVSELQTKLTQFQSSTTMIDPKAQSNQAVQYYVSMVQQRQELELKLATMSASYSQDNPRVKLLKEQLSSLSSQIKAMSTDQDSILSVRAAPEKIIDYLNLSRDLEIANKIYSVLLASLEQAAVDKIDDEIYVERLDVALLPERASISLPVFIFYMGAFGAALAILGLLLYFLVNTGVFGLRQKASLRREP